MLSVTSTWLSYAALYSLQISGMSGRERSLDLVVNLSDRAADHLVARNVLVGMKDVARLVVAIDVRRNEVERHVGLLGVADHFAYPRRLRRCRAAHAQRRRNRLDVAGGVVVKLEVGWLLRRAAPEVEVGFVPDFEIPLRNFINTVALHEVLGELRDQVVPLRIILRRRDVGVVPERLQVRSRSQLVGHEAELNKRLHAQSEQAIVNLIDVGEVVDGPALLVLIVHTHIVIENAVEADVLEAGDLAHRPHVAAIRVAQAEYGTPGAEHLLPVMREGVGGRTCVDGDGFRRVLRG